MTSWTLRSATLEATVDALGGMVAPVAFILGDGRRVFPFKVSDWADRPEAQALPPVMRHLRGEFACVPFGAPKPPPSAPDAWKALFAEEPAFTETHGVCANHAWSAVEVGADALRLAIDYPEAHPVARVEKRVRVGEALDVELAVHARRPVRISLGMHPVLDIGDEPGAAGIEAPFRFGRTFPGDYVPGVSRFAQDARFDALDAVPLRDGGRADISRLPLPFPAEEVVQLCGAEGRLHLTRRDLAYRLDMTWDAAAFPSLLLGIANAGRADAPFDGRWRALYAEPVAAAFGMGSSIGANPGNPIAREGVATAVDLAPQTPFVTRYRFAVTDLATAEGT